MSEAQVLVEKEPVLKKMPKVLITDNIHLDAVQILQETCDVVYEKKLSHEELLERIPQFDALLIRSASKVSEDILEQAANLKIVGRAGVGTDNIDLAKATEQGVIVVNSPAGNTIAASEHTIGMLMAMVRHIPEGDETLKQGKWERSKLTGVEVFGKTLGVIGLGKIGSRVALVCRALGMKILVYDPFLAQSHADELGVAIATLEEIWAQADFITIHAPKTKDTANLINAEILARCKPGVRFINCARGGIINEADLTKAIESGHVAGAALDVFDSEPLGLDSPLLSLAHQVVLTPHLGASTEEAQINVALDVAEQIRDFFIHGYARSAVNIPTLRKEVLDPVRHYMPMAEVLGSFLRQFAKGAAQSVEVIARGDIAKEHISPLTLAVMKGQLSLSREGVNYVNALHIAEENGISVKESLIKEAANFSNLIEAHLETDQGHYQIAGTLIAKDNFRIVLVNGYRMSLEPSSHILLTPHINQPGMVAKVATILGQEGINISAMQVARDSESEEGVSMMMFNLDNPIYQSVQDMIKGQTGIIDVIYVSL